jgi:aspartate-semialdehyde dehydrogenase
MSRRYDVAIVGATGLVGRTMAQVLDEHDFPVGALRMLASSRSAGSTLRWRDGEITVEEAGPDAFAGVEIALFSAGAGTSRALAPHAARAGATVIDNSSAWRMDPEVPLVVPEVNPDDVEWNRGIIANPNCSTIQMVVALNPLHRVNPIKRIVVDTYQSVGGTGNKGIEELQRQIRDGSTATRVYPRPIAFNLLPHIDDFLEDGSSKEEAKMRYETRKIMHAPEIKIVATTVRVPVYMAHSEAVHVELTEPMSPAEAREILAAAPGVIVEDDPANGVYPTPREKAGRDEVFVGRVRRNEVFDNGLSMWIVADNVRKGAATNAVQIARELVARNLVGRERKVAHAVSR